MTARADPRIRAAVADCAPSVRQLSDIELRAFLVAILAEVARRDGPATAAEWAQGQADRLRAPGAVTA